MLFKAKPGYDKIPCNYHGKQYIFYTDKTTEAPECMKKHKFLIVVKEEIKEEVKEIKEIKEIKKEEKYANN